MPNVFADLIPKPRAGNVFADLIPAKEAPRPVKPGLLGRIESFVTAKRGAEAQADIGESHGFLDRVGDLLSRGVASTGAGLQSLMGAAEDFNTSPAMSWNQAPWSHDPIAARDAHFEKARNARAVAATPMQNEVTWDTVKAKPTVANIGKFIVEGGVQSLPGMAAAATSLPLYIGSLTGQLGQQRAENDGRENLTLADAGAAAPAALISGALEKVGLGHIGSKIAGKVAGNAAMRFGKAVGIEGLTEGAQTGIEYAGSNLGTDAGMNLSDALDQMASAALVGAGVGGGAHVGIEAPGAIARGARAAGQSVRPQSVRAQLPAPDVPINDNVFADLIPDTIEPPANAPAPVAVDPQPVANPAPAAAGGDGLGQVAPKIEPAPAAPAPVEPPTPTVEAPKLRPDPGELGDGERLVRTPAGGSIRTKFEVVDAKTLAQAEGANQNRDRGRDTTTMQVQDIISKFDPELLHEDPSTDRGAPIVGADNAIDSGNGRVLTLNKIYEQYPEQAAKYRAMIEARGHAIPEGVTNPVLIQRRMTDFTPEQRRQFVVDSNKDSKLTLSPVERARSDADTITPDMLAKYAGGDLNSTGNQGFVAAFSGNLMAGEMGDMIGSDRRLTPNGHQRIENAVVAAAYGKPKLLERMMESSHDDIRAITGSMADVAPAWAAMRQSVKAGGLDKQYDITDDLADAAARLSDARKAGTRPNDILAQADAFDQMSPVTAELIRAFHNTTMTRAASRRAVTSLLGDYVAAAKSQQASDGLFGAEQAKPPLSILKRLLEARDNPNGVGLALDDAPITKETTNGATPARAARAARGGRADDTNDAPRGDAGGDAALAGGAERSAPARSKPGADRLKALAAVADEVDDTVDYREGRGALEDKGAYQQSFADASFTTRASVFNSAAEAMGLDPDAFALLPGPRQVTLLRRAIATKFGIAVDVDPSMQTRIAIDQMLDAFQNVQAMAHVLDLPNGAMSLGGKLTLRLQKKGKFLGQFQPGANKITLPQRSNSFAHEWAHALDFHLLAALGEGGKGLSGAIRQRGSAVDTDGAMPAGVREAFVGLLNDMFFDRADTAAKIMQLEAKIAATESAKVKAASQLAIDKLIAGNSQVRDIRSAFYKGAKTFDGAGDYWTSPTEMMARAFEAYTSYKVEAAGLTTEFIGKGDANYLSDADERFAKTFPKGDERAIIFAAFENLFGQMADAHTLAQGPGAERPGGSQRSLVDYDRTPAVAKERGVIRRELTAIRNAARKANLEKAGRADDPKGALEKLADLNGAMFMSMAGNLRMIQARSNSPAMQTLIDLLTKQDGKGDRTVARTFSEDVHLQSKAAINRLANILKANAADHLDVAETKTFRDLLTGVIEPTGAPGVAAGPRQAAVDAPPANLVKAAAGIRHLLDNEFYVNKQAGIDLGYTRNGYLNRALDLPRVHADQEGFLGSAKEVYEIVFDKEFGEPDALLGNDEQLPVFMKLAGFLARQGYGIPSLAETRAQMKEVNALAARAERAAAKGDGDVASKLEGEMAKTSEELGELFAELHGEVRPAYAEERAAAWLAKINLVAGEEHNASSPDSKYTKSRSLPEQADSIMAKYYIADPGESVTNYLSQSALRTAYARRFGHDGKRRVDLFKRMAAEGVSPDDQRTAERILDIATGRTRSELPQSVQDTAAFVNAAGTMALLPRAVISSLAEPFTSGLVTGDARGGFKMLGMMIGSALGSPSGKVRHELARALGIISDLASDGIMEARYGQTFADQTRWDRYASTMFRRTGLTALTRAQKAAGVGLGHAYLDSLAQQIAGKPGKGRDGALALFRELGIRDPEAFAAELLASGRLLALEDLATPFGQDYATAQLRFSRMVIQEPDAMDRPEMAQNSVGRVIYGITGFSYGYWRNIVKRNGVYLNELRKTKGGAAAALYATALLGSAAIAYLMGTTISTIREKLLNPKRWKDLQDKGDLESTMAQLGFTRTFSFGAADTVIQTWSGLKYQRDLSNAFIGPGPGFLAQNAQKIISPLVSNSRKKNTAEYNALQGAYSIASPFLAFGLARIPGGPVIDTTTGVGMAYVTSANARDQFATAIVGTKDTPKTKTPTAYDKFLDGAFGEKKRKPRAD